jgi:hypothetical protein
MFGMIIPDRNVPNFCTATRVLDVLLTGAASVLTTDPLPSGQTRGRTVPRACGNNPCRTRPDGPTHFDDHDDDHDHADRRPPIGWGGDAGLNEENCRAYHRCMSPVTEKILQLSVTGDRASLSTVTY